MLLRLLADHWARVALVALLCAILLGATAVILATSRREARTGRHGRPRGVYHGKPTEIRRHRAGGREHAWPGTITVVARPEPTDHVLDEADEAAVRLWAARFEDTGEITQAGLEAILDPRPLVGAS